MAGLVPAIHVFVAPSKTWMPGTRPGMTEKLRLPVPRQRPHHAEHAVAERGVIVDAAHRPTELPPARVELPSGDPAGRRLAEGEIAEHRQLCLGLLRKCGERLPFRACGVVEADVVLLQ